MSLYLLDSNTESNAPDDRDVTRHLYGGDGETRIQQEIVLGRGGVRLLRQLQIEPAMGHMNEGHAAFFSLERLERLVSEDGMSFDDACARVRATTLFTTHTPVPAGHDRFDEDLMRKYFADTAERLGVPWDRFIGLGRNGDSDDFNMTYLALRLSSFCNGVSALHGTVSRRLLRSAWPDRSEEEVPIATITNGVHPDTWASPTVAPWPSWESRRRRRIRRAASCAATRGPAAWTGCWKRVGEQGRAPTTGVGDPDPSGVPPRLGNRKRAR